MIRNGSARRVTTQSRRQIASAGRPATATRIAEEHDRRDPIVADLVEQIPDRPNQQRPGRPRTHIGVAGDRDEVLSSKIRRCASRSRAATIQKAERKSRDRPPPESGRNTLANRWQLKSGQRSGLYQGRHPHRQRASASFAAGKPGQRSQFSIASPNSPLHLQAVARSKCEAGETEGYVRTCNSIAKHANAAIARQAEGQCGNVERGDPRLHEQHLIEKGEQSCRYCGTLRREQRRAAQIDRDDGYRAEQSAGVAPAERDIDKGPDRQRHHLLGKRRMHRIEHWFGQHRVRAFVWPPAHNAPHRNRACPAPYSAGDQGGHMRGNKQDGCGGNDPDRRQARNNGPIRRANPMKKAAIAPRALLSHFWIFVALKLFSFSRSTKKEAYLSIAHCIKRKRKRNSF